MKRTLWLTMIAVVGMSSLTSAQQRGASLADFAVEARLFPLEYLSNADAAKLVAPFVQGMAARWDVFEAGPAVRGITVRASKEMLVRVDSILKANDRPVPTITLKFQVIAAVDSGSRDAAIPNDVESTLKELFRFGGYRLLAQGSATVGVENFSLTMSQGSDRFFILTGTVWGIRVVRGGANDRPTAAQLNVSLKGPLEQANGRAGTSTQWQQLLSTGVTVPIGQTVVLGSAAGNSGQRALILTVRPEAK